MQIETLKQNRKKNKTNNCIQQMFCVNKKKLSKQKPYVCLFESFLFVDGNATFCLNLFILFCEICV